VPVPVPVPSGQHDSVSMLASAMAGNVCTGPQAPFFWVAANAPDAVLVS
jgi:hypothetical protein